MGLLKNIKKVGDNIVALFSDGSSTEIQSAIGYTKGQDVPVGRIGEVLSFPLSSGSALSMTNSTWYDLGWNFTLSAGNWLIIVECEAAITSPGTADYAVALAVRTSTGTLLEARRIGAMDTNAAGDLIGWPVTLILCPLNISNTTDYKVSVISNRDLSCSINANDANLGSIGGHKAVVTAIRIG